MENHEQAAPQATQADPTSFDDSALIAELGQLDAAPEEALSEPETAPEQSEPEQPAEGQGEAEAQAGEPETADGAAQPEEAPAETEPDPELTKRLEAISREEQRRNERIAAKEAELEAKLRKFEERESSLSDRLQRFEDISKRAAYDPVAALEALGVPAEMFEDAARSLYEARPDADPAQRGRSRQALQAREAMDLARKAAERAEAAERKLQEYQSEQRQAAQVASYMSDVHGSIGDSHKLVSNLANVDRAELDSRLRQAAYDLAGKTGEIADPADVVAHLEKSLTAERERAAKIFAFSLATGSNVASKTETPAKAPEKQAARTISNDLATATQPRTEPQTEEELNAEIIRAMRSGQLE